MKKIVILMFVLGSFLFSKNYYDPRELIKDYIKIAENAKIDKSNNVDKSSINKMKKLIWSKDAIRASVYIRAYLRWKKRQQKRARREKFTLQKGLSFLKPRKYGMTHVGDIAVYFAIYKNEELEGYHYNELILKGKRVNGDVAWVISGL